MHSRQYGVLLVTIFITFAPMLAFGSNETITTEPSSSTSETPTIISPSALPHGDQPHIESDASATTNASSPTVTTSQPEIANSSTANKTIELNVTATTTATANDNAAATTTTTTTAPAVTTVKVDPLSNVSSESTTNSSTTSKPVINSQVARDAEPAGKCSSGYQALAKESAKWVPEKVVLNVAEGVPMTAAQFCNQSLAVMELNTVCTNMKEAVENSEGIKAAKVVAGLAAMFTSVCAKPDNLPVVTGNGTQCSEAIVETTKKCTATMKSVYSYPTEMLYNEIMNSSCTMLNDAKTCIAKGMEASCSSAQQEAVSNLMILVLKDHQCSVEPTTMAPVPVSSTATPATTASTTSTTTTAHKNSATNFQVNVFTLLPVLCLAFKFY